MTPGAPGQKSNKQRVAAVRRAAAKKRKAARERTKDPAVRAQEAHEKKRKHAVAMIKWWQRQQRLATTRLRKWTRKLVALQASSHRVGKPRGYKPKPLTQAELDAADAAFLD